MKIIVLAALWMCACCFYRRLYHIYVHLLQWLLCYTFLFMAQFFSMLLLLLLFGGIGGDGDEDATVLIVVVIFIIALSLILLLRCYFLLFHDWLTHVFAYKICLFPEKKYVFIACDFRWKMAMKRTNGDSIWIFYTRNCLYKLHV